MIKIRPYIQIEQSLEWPVLAGLECVCAYYLDFVSGCMHASCPQCPAMRAAAQKADECLQRASPGLAHRRQRLPMPCARPDIAPAGRRARAPRWTGRRELIDQTILWALVGSIAPLCS